MDRDRLARRHEQHKRYYAKTAFKYKPREWTVVEDKMVIAHAIPDSELSEIIRRSMKAISNRRWRLKRAEGPIVEYQAADDRVQDASIVERSARADCDGPGIRDPAEERASELAGEVDPPREAHL